METLLQWNSLALMAHDTQVGTLDIDAQLMLRFKTGDLIAFETLFSRHSRSIVNFAYKFVRNREIAEELAQEVFLKVHDAASTYRVEAKFTTWLYRIATNVCLNEIRRPQFRAFHQSLDESISDYPDERQLELVDGQQPGPQAQMERRDIALALRQALEQLPEKQRLAFILNKYQDLSYAEVAEVMRTSEKAVKSLIHRAKEALCSQLKPILSRLI